MAKWTLFVVLLLPAMMCLNVTHVSINGKKPHLTPLCSNDTFISIIMCKVRTERWSDGCQLSYLPERDFENNCSSEVTLKSENQNVYLHLEGLTQEDNGNYNCDCADIAGTHSVHLKVTVEVPAEAEDESRDSQMKVMAMGGAASVIVLTVVIFGIFYCGKRHGRKPHKPLSNTPDMEPNDIEPYSTFISRETGLYSTIRVNGCDTNTNHSVVWN